MSGWAVAVTSSSRQLIESLTDSDIENVGTGSNCTVAESMQTPVLSVASNVYIVVAETVAIGLELLAELIPVAGAH